MNTGLTILATAILFLALGVLVGVWLRGLIQADSTADAGTTPPEPRQQPPTLTPSAPSTTQHPILHPLVLLETDPPTRQSPAVVVHAPRRAFRVFYQGISWEHYRENDQGHWCYKRVDSYPKPVPPAPTGDAE